MVSEYLLPPERQKQIDFIVHGGKIVEVSPSGEVLVFEGTEGAYELAKGFIEKSVPKNGSEVNLNAGQFDRGDL